MPNADGRATLEEYVAFLRAREAAREAKRRVKLEARPSRLALLKAAAEKRMRRKVRNLRQVMDLDWMRAQNEALFGE